MKRNTLLLLLATFFVLNACGPKGPSESQKMRDEIIAVHDEVMPKMGELKSQEKEALAKAEVTSTEEPLDTAKVEAYKSLAYDLNHAHDAMFDWMHQYETEDGELAAEELKVYLEGQLTKVKEVNLEVKEALDKAEKNLK